MAARKVLISFLGAGSLRQCYYYYKDTTNRQPATRYVQEALIRIFCQNWSDNDVQYFFVTDRAKSANWENNLEFNEDRGLAQILSDIKKTKEFANLNYHDVSIRDGNNENEIWDIFSVIFDCLQEGDEVYLDVTNAFRSLPMLSVVLLNYAKFLKRIHVKAILYGNFEAKNKQFEAPIIDVTSFSDLQDWTSAANEFINFANTDRFLNLANQVQDTDLRLFAETLNAFTKELSTVRGMEIFKGDKINKVREIMPRIRENSDIKPFKPLLNEIEKALDDFEQREIKNFFSTAKFCSSHNLIQQAITILQEGIVCYILSDLGFDWKNYNYRKIVSGSFLYDENSYRAQTKLSNEMQISKQIRQNPSFLLFSEMYPNLHNCRNDINHAGLSKNPKTSAEIEGTLKRSLSHIEELQIGLL